MGALEFSAAASGALPLYIVPKNHLPEALSVAAPSILGWASCASFTGGAGEVLVVRSEDGTPRAALVGLGDATDRARKRFVAGGARSKLPKGTFRLANADLDGLDPDELCLGWLLAGYRFDRYKSGSAPEAALVAPKGVDAPRLEAIASGEALTRDLINTPASDMGPEELETEARTLASEFGASIDVISGEALIDRNFPMIHTVGRASPRQPRLIDLRWGATGPRVTLVGKGVCFDTGGLNLKPGASMGLMKKDMGCLLYTSDAADELT